MDELIGSGRVMAQDYRRHLCGRGGRMAPRSGATAVNRGSVGRVSTLRSQALLVREERNMMVLEDPDFPTGASAAFESAACEQTGSALEPYIYTQ
jgi:hypothetical protein